MGRRSGVVYKLSLTTDKLEKLIKKWLESNKKSPLTECPQLKWAAKTFKKLRDDYKIPTERFSELMTKVPSERPQVICDEILSPKLERYRGLKAKRRSPHVYANFVRAVAEINLACRDKSILELISGRDPLSNFRAATKTYLQSIGVDADGRKLAHSMDAAVDTLLHQLDLYDQIKPKGRLPADAHD